MIFCIDGKIDEQTDQTRVYREVTLLTWKIRYRVQKTFRC